MSESIDAIRQSVHDRYTRVAEESSGCCEPQTGSCCSAYPVEELSLLPAEAVASGRGCGNPTALAQLREGEVVLDLGSGGGLDALLAAQRVGPSGRVYGVDATPAMIDLARRNAARLGADNVEFRPGDIEALPLPDSTVDVILSNCVVNLTPDKSKAFTEAFRVLRPGGRLAISDIVIDPNLDGLPLGPAEVRAGLDWAGCAAGALTSGELHAALAQAGFEQIHLQAEYRMTSEDLPVRDPATANALGPDGLRELAARFTGMSIAAIRPTG